MRVLHLYAGNLYGGIESILVTFARERGQWPDMQPEFGLCFEGRVAEELRDENVPVHMLGEAHFSRPWTVWQARRRLGELLRREAYDVAICHACWPHALFGPTVLASSVPLVFWARDIPNGKHWLDRLASRHVPAFALANSQFTLGAMPRLFPKVPAGVCYNPVAVPCQETREQNRRQTRAELKVPESRVVIVTACRLEKWKGHQALLQGLSRMPRELDWEAWIIGGSQRSHEKVYLAELRSLAQQLGIGSRVNFLGQRSHVPRLLCGADIHCQPNTGPEPFGNVFIEALGAALPVVTTSIGAAPEIVTSECGILVEPDNPASLADALSALVADPRRRATLGAGAPMRARELCDPATQLRALHDLLRGAVGAEKPLPYQSASAVASRCEA